MTKMRFGIFGKVFLYTLVFLLFAVSMTGLIFASQFKEFYDYLQVQQFTVAFEPLKTSIVKEEGVAQIVKTANDFHDRNQSYDFSIETLDGNVVYTTLKGKPEVKTRIVSDSSVQIQEISKPETRIQIVSGASTQKVSGASTVMGIITTGIPETTTMATVTVQDSRVVPDAGVARPDGESMIKVTNNPDNIVIGLNDGLFIRTASKTDSDSIYHDFVKRAAVFLFLLLCASVAGAVLFARGITNPIRRLAADTCKMACLEDVTLPVFRQDEVGQLSRDVHNMYEKLKLTISQLQTEIQREKEMEENQRYFFSAASHELKTPIAAASALIEGMMAGIGDYANHPKYLRECLNMMKAQNRIITEILEIVKLSDERIVPHREKVTLQSVLHTILPEYYTLADQKKQSIVLELKEEDFCVTDRKMICNVLSNVMMNAIQNSGEGEEIKIWSEHPDQDTIRLCVLNTNARIDEETKVKLFEPFYRVDKARSRRDGRGGLGLTIVKKILDTLNAEYALEARDSDVIFWVDFPVNQ